MAILPGRQCLIVLIKSSVSQNHPFYHRQPYCSLVSSHPHLSWSVYLYCFYRLFHSSTVPRWIQQQLVCLRLCHLLWVSTSFSSSMLSHHQPSFFDISSSSPSQVKIKPDHDKVDKLSLPMRRQPSGLLTLHQSLQQPKWWLLRIIPALHLHRHWRPASKLSRVIHLQTNPSKKHDKVEKSNTANETTIQTFTPESELTATQMVAVGPASDTLVLRPASKKLSWV